MLNHLLNVIKCSCSMLLNCLRYPALFGVRTKATHYYAVPD